MQTKELRIRVGNDASVGATVALPIAPGVPFGVLLAHGAGNDRHAPLLVHVQRTLAERGVACVTFNFLYKEQGRRLPDPLGVLIDTYRKVLGSLRRRSALQVEGWVIGGKSLGGRVASHLVAEGEDVLGLVFLGYPLHPAGSLERLRADHLNRVHVPMLFVQGTRDPLCRLDRLDRVLHDLRHRYGARVEIRVVEGGDHSFVLPRTWRRSQEEVYKDIACEIAKWVYALDR